MSEYKKYKDGFVNYAHRGATEICPRATLMTAEDVARWHSMGLRVRAWGVKDEDVMKYACECGVDGMTVNFPDKLEAYRN